MKHFKVSIYVLLDFQVLLHISIGFTVLITCHIRIFQYVHARNAQGTFHVKLDSDTTLKPSDGTTFLGLFLDSDMKWKSHSSELLRKLSRATFAVGVISRVAGTSTALIVYHAYFASHLRFGIIFWGRTTEFEAIFRTQKKALRRIFGLTDRCSCRPIFREHSLLTAPAVYVLELALFVFRNKDRFQERQVAHLYNTRFRGLRYPEHRLTLLEKGPYYMGIKVYNVLPQIVKESATPGLFKKKLKTILIGMCPYKVEEFFEKIAST